MMSTEKRRERMHEYYVNVIKPKRGHSETRGRPRIYADKHEAMNAICTRQKASRVAKKIQEWPFYNIGDELNAIVDKCGTEPTLEMRQRLLSVFENMVTAAATVDEITSKL
jgi:hypothetical protein